MESYIVDGMMRVEKGHCGADLIIRGLLADEKLRENLAAALQENIRNDGVYRKEAQNATVTAKSEQAGTRLYARDVHTQCTREERFDSMHIALYNSRLLRLAIDALRQHGYEGREIR